jgi:hypothetical protein
MSSAARRMRIDAAAIAIANKTAGIAWVIMVHGGVYKAGHRAPQYRAEATRGCWIRDAWRGGDPRRRRRKIATPEREEDAVRRHRLRRC